MKGARFHFICSSVIAGLLCQTPLSTLYAQGTGGGSSGGSSHVRKEEREPQYTSATPVSQNHLALLQAQAEINEIHQILFGENSISVPGGYVVDPFQPLIEEQPTIVFGSESIGEFGDWFFFTPDFVDDFTVEDLRNSEAFGSLTPEMANHFTNGTVTLSLVMGRAQSMVTGEEIAVEFSGTKIGEIQYLAPIKNHSLLSGVYDTSPDDGMMPLPGNNPFKPYSIKDLRRARDLADDPEGFIPNNNSSGFALCVVWEEPCPNGGSVIMGICYGPGASAFPEATDDNYQKCLKIHAIDSGLALKKCYDEHKKNVIGCVLGTAGVLLACGFLIAALIPCFFPNPGSPAVCAGVLKLAAACIAAIAVAIKACLGNYPAYQACMIKAANKYKAAKKAVIDHKCQNGDPTQFNNCPQPDNLVWPP